MSLAETRAGLAQLQGQLVSCLACGTAAPEGFDEGRLRAAAAALAAKRRREVRLAWPILARTLGDAFDVKFDEYVRHTPLPRRGGPLADGRAFARHLQARGELPDEARLEVLRVDLSYAWSSTGLVPRRGPVVRAALLRRPHRLLLALRLPWLGERWFAFP